MVDKRDNSIIVPPLKWAGGKRWMMQAYSHLFPTGFRRYIEPFLGSGAVYFALRPNNALLADINRELINLYEVIRDDPHGLRRRLQQHHAKHSNSHYYRVRSSRPRSDLSRAARTLYLNRTCWNGLYRVNRRGEFNVPIGTKTNVILDSDDFPAVSEMLQRARIESSDFEQTISEAGAGDFVFVDPPYTVAHNINGFVKYNEKIFSWADQERLAESVMCATRRGAKVLVTNANHHSIRQLYKGLPTLVLKRTGVIAADNGARGKFEEIVIRCY